MTLNPSSINLFEAIFNQEFPDRTAILTNDQAITYRELAAQTQRAIAQLNTLQVQPGERVALLLHDSPEFIANFVGVIALGAIAVPINMALRLNEQIAILKDCSARLALVESDVFNSLSPAAREQLPQLKQIIVAAQASDRNPTPATGSVAQRRSADRSADKDQPAFILYTSGSTGEPKGAVHRQSDIFYTNETFCREVLHVRADDRLFSSSRLPFAYGLGNSLTFPLLNGATSILCREKPTPEIISDIFSRLRPTIFFAVPVVYKMLLENHRGVPLDCSSLRLCVSAGEALPAKLGEDWERTFGVPVLDGIGSTEMLHMFMSNHQGDVRYGSSGKVLQGYAARLLNPEGQPTPIGDEGHLWIKGDSAAAGYWQRSETTAMTFVDGWVRTGDLYRCDADGYFYHMGRSDDCFKSSGQWVSPVEVEGVLLRHDDVLGVAVVEDFNEAGLPCACAFVVRRDQATAKNEDELKRELRVLARENLSRFKQPQRYIFLSELPYTATGKIQRFKLRERMKGL